MGRFVVKFDIKNPERKIKKEKTLFRQYVSDLLVPGYASEYEETITHEAIRYNYASSDSKKDSFPFSKLINDKIRNKYNYSFTLEKVIDELFDCAPYQIWHTKKSLETITVKTLYSDYLKSEAKIFKAISLIKGIDESATESEELVLNYKKIKNYSLKIYKKICHGDLHSENFFKDEQAGVYLIDFGWTNQHHSVIDHATLECSLKFKHLPLYVPLEELTNCETELLSINSFSKSFNLSFINRQSVWEIAKLIIQIREDAKQHMTDKNNPLEYLISLFIINFRQIQYPDLNQAFALATAEILSKKIVELISE
jgi:tRNA A-37 threonylcarbamoyl transferase component Bud32